MITALAVVTGGFGALARYGLAGAVQRRTGPSSPWGTAVVNVTGAALLGVLLALHPTGRTSDSVLAVAGTGFAGGFTTFSTWMVESIRLAEPGNARQLIAAAANVVGMLAVGIAAVVATSWLIRHP